MSADRETRKRASAIYRVLTKTYPDVRCELDFENPLQLVIATVLSAQCTDKRVNAVTPRLFKKYKNVRAYAKAPLADIEEIIYPLGFYHAKARHIKGLATTIIENFDGEVPGTLEELIEIWVGRYLGFHHKPIVILDPYGVYRKLHELVIELEDQEFVKPGMRDLVLWSESIDESIQFIMDHYAN